MLIAILPAWLLGSATGSRLAAGMFLTTTPGCEPSLGGFPVLPGQLGAAAVCTAGETLKAA